MKGRYTALVHRVRVRAGIDEVRDHIALRIRTGVLSARVSICGVVQRFGSPSVAGANRSASCDERLGDTSMMGGRCDMQGRVARVDVMTNRDEKVGMGILTARANAKRMRSQAW